VNQSYRKRDVSRLPQKETSNGKANYQEAQIAAIQIVCISEIAQVPD
jgi:hypothetical protein